MPNKLKIKKLFFLNILIFIGLFFVLNISNAQTLNLDYPPLRVPGGIFDLNDAYESGKVGLRQVIILFYVLTLWSSGILAFVLLIYTGLVYIISGGKPAKRKEAFQKFKNVWIGVAVLLFSFFFLNILNPGITNLDLYVFLSTTGGGTDYNFDTDIAFALPKSQALTAEEAGTFTCQWTGADCVANINNCNEGFSPDCHFGTNHDSASYSDFCTEAQDNGQAFVCVKEASDISSSEGSGEPEPPPGADGIDSTEEGVLRQDCTNYSIGARYDTEDVAGNSYFYCDTGILTDTFATSWRNKCLNDFSGHESGVLDSNNEARLYCGYLVN
ncbi:MAG: hypothetical protein WDZ40_04430 [Candidatus Spechtbacterales bacterium]